MKKAISILLVAVMIVSLLCGCSKGDKENKTDGKGMKELTVAGLNGGMQSFPIYIAEKNGWFEELGLKLNLLYFENGPVQVEAISSWDLATTGIGGVLAGAITYNAQVIASPNSDDGTQCIYARKDSPIVAAGQGHNSLNPEIYGDAESWKGQKVLCTAGNVLQYLLMKTLEGAGATLEDVDFVSMDNPTANAAFLAGEGDVAVMTGAIALAEDKKDYVLVSSGNMAQCGLDCNVIINENAAESKKEEITLFLEAYFRAIDWIASHKDEATSELMKFCEETGKDLSEESAKTFINAERFYSLKDNYEMLNAKDGGTCEMENRIMNILKFFIQVGNYAEGDDEKFAGHINSSFVNELYEKQK